MPDGAGRIEQDGMVQAEALLGGAGLSEGR